MSNVQKKVIPKFQKKLGGFLSEENTKLVKESALVASLVAMGVFGMINQADAYCHHTITSSSISFGQLIGTPTAVNRWYLGGATTGCSASNSQLVGTIYTDNAVVAPYSAIVNGHANGFTSVVGGGFMGGSFTTNTSYTYHANTCVVSSDDGFNDGCGTGDFAGSVNASFQCTDGWNTTAPFGAGGCTFATYGI